MLETKEPMNFW